MTEQTQEEKFLMRLQERNAAAWNRWEHSNEQIFVQNQILIAIAENLAAIKNLLKNGLSVIGDQT